MSAPCAIPVLITVVISLPPHQGRYLEQVSVMVVSFSETVLCF